MGAVDLVVVGGGVMGAATAWRAAQRGASVVLIEQHAPGHSRGSSHGTSRIFRHAYAQPAYVALAAQARRGWAELAGSEEVEAELLAPVGAVDHGDPTMVAALAEALDGADVDHVTLDPDEAEARWPGLRFDTTVLFHAAAGRLHADACVRALHDAAEALGADVRLGVTVDAVDGGEAGGVEVHSSDGSSVTAGAAVVAAGAWASSLLGPVDGLPELRVTVEQPAHFVPVDQAAVARWPTFIHHPGAAIPATGRSVNGVYGLVGEEGVKLGFHGVGPEVDPKEADRPIDGELLDDLRRYAEAWVPGALSTRVEPVSCLYTTTPDHDPVVDRSGPLTILAGFSGHGFKFAPVIGEMAVDLALDRADPHPTFALGARAPHQGTGLPR